MGWHGSYSWTSIADVKADERANLASFDILKEASTQYGRHWWLVLKLKDSVIAEREAQGKTVDEVTKRPFIMLCLIERGGATKYVVKYIDETMGPVEHDCPESLLALAPEVPADPGTNSFEWSTKWRATVREVHAARKARLAKAKALKAGDKVWLTRNSQGPFTITSVTPKKILGTPDGWTSYRLPKSRIDRVEVV